MSRPGHKRHRTTLTLALLGIGMFGFSFALVPLYNLFCEITGAPALATRAKLNQRPLQQPVKTGRLVTLKLDTTVHPGLPWQFEPLERQIRVEPGMPTVITFAASNRSSQLVAARAIPSVAPWQATDFINKIHCFCFQQQQLEGGEQAKMTLTLQVSPDLPADIHSLTLSYSLMRSDPRVTISSVGPDTARLAINDRWPL